MTAQLITQAEKDLLPYLDVEEMNSRFTLKERQLQEIADSMKSLNPKDVLIQQYENEARQAAEEAQKHRDSKLKQMHEEMERLKAERLRKEDEKKKKMAAQMA